MRMLRVDILNQGGILLEKKKQIEYTIEREFLSKFSVEELLIRIIKTHVNHQVQQSIGVK